MNLDDFVAKFAEQFDDTDPAEITKDTVFHDLEEWGSLTGMSVIAMARAVYGKTISGAEIRSCVTVEDLFNVISAK